MKPDSGPWLSIQRTLPLSMLVLLVGVVGAFTVVTYQRVKADRLDAAGSRLRQVADELAELTEASVQARVAYAQRLASDPRITAAASGDGGAKASLNAVLDSIVTESRNTTDVQLVTTGGTVLGGTSPQLDLAGELPTSANEPGAMVGPIRVRNDSIFSETIAPVIGVNGEVVAHLVQSRQAASATQIRDLLQELIGGDALFLVGNAHDRVWTDMVTPVDGPPVHLLSDSLAHRYKRGSAGERYGAASAVRNTPWIIVVEYPLSAVLAPAKKLLTEISVAAFVLIVIGGLGASILSRRITTPLREATRAAESVAAGDYGVRLNFQRRDEIGHLSEALNVMAGKVEAAQHRLEEKVVERTHALNKTLQELKSAQSELVKKEKLAVLGQLSSGLGHELRNPLGVMSNAVYFLQAISSSGNPRVQEYLEIIREQIGLSEGIIGSLLDYARAREPGTGAIELKAVIVDQLNRLGEKRGVTVNVNVPDTLVAQADRVQLGQVIFNLLMNARQALEDRPGAITVSAREEGDDRIAISISDSGRGISPQEIHRIFEPLYTTRARGIGLGLSVTRAFVDAHGGDITVESREGAGSTFTVDWPAARPVGVLSEA